MPAWKQPNSYEDWGKKCDPPLSHAWLERIGMEMVPAQAVAVARLVLPSFIEYDGCIFLEHKFSVDSYQVWSAELENKVAVEKMINHTHVFDLFYEDEILDEEAYALFAETLARTWELALSVAFAGRSFQLIVSKADDDYGPTVTFCSTI